MEWCENRPARIREDGKIPRVRHGQALAQEYRESRISVPREGLAMLSLVKRERRQAVRICWGGAWILRNTAEGGSAT